MVEERRDIQVPFVCITAKSRTPSVERDREIDGQSGIESEIETERERERGNSMLRHFLCQKNAGRKDPGCWKALVSS